MTKSSLCLSLSAYADMSGRNGGQFTFVHLLLKAQKNLDRTPEIGVIVSDIRMPGMDGNELLKTIRGRYSNRVWLQVIL
ncbi:hypothetical protein CQ057_22510 [Ochrobactrum sp. MYb49]|nr:hypothetical protein CQ057_22510 [Ochrobactrum sp. MYb49]